MGPRPHRHTPRPRPSLPASLHERNIAPAGHPTAWLTSSVKEKSPPLAQNWRKTALSRMQGRRIFHGTPQHLTPGRFFFHPSPIHTPQARQNSPCSAPPAPRRDKVRPARAKQTKISVFSPAGRILSRSHTESRPARRVFLVHEHPRFHPRRTLRPQPKPCVACAHATTPVAHWPHD